MCARLKRSLDSVAIVPNAFGIGGRAPAGLALHEAERGPAGLRLMLHVESSVVGLARRRPRKLHGAPHSHHVDLRHLDRESGLGLDPDEMLTSLPPVAGLPHHVGKREQTGRNRLPHQRALLRPRHPKRKRLLPVGHLIAGLGRKTRIRPHARKRQPLYLHQLALVVLLRSQKLCQRHLLRGGRLPLPPPPRSSSHRRC
jgi:hypothetical protein